MTDSVRVLVFGDDILRDALLGSDQGDHNLDHGLADVVAREHPGCEIDLRYERHAGLDRLRRAVESQTTDEGFGPDDFVPDVIIIAMTVDAERLPERSSDPAEAVSMLMEDLMAVVDGLKDATGAHVLVCNVSTFDPDGRVSNFSGVDPEPISLRAHRIDLVLLKVSHLLGLSIIDVDRIMAEAGCGRVVPAALSLSAEGCRLVRDETERVLADYGFLDERPLVAQVGNRAVG